MSISSKGHAAVDALVAQIAQELAAYKIASANTAGAVSDDEEKQAEAPNDPDANEGSSPEDAEGDEELGSEQDDDVAAHDTDEDAAGGEAGDRDEDEDNANNGDVSNAESDGDDHSNGDGETGNDSFNDNSDAESDSDNEGSDSDDDSSSSGPKYPPAGTMFLPDSVVNDETVEFFEDLPELLKGGIPAPLSQDHLMELMMLVIAILGDEDKERRLKLDASAVTWLADKLSDGNEYWKNAEDRGVLVDKANAVAAAGLQEAQGWLEEAAGDTELQTKEIPAGEQQEPIPSKEHVAVEFWNMLADLEGQRRKQAAAEAEAEANEPGALWKHGKVRFPIPPEVKGHINDVTPETAAMINAGYLEGPYPMTTLDEITRARMSIEDDAPRPLRLALQMLAFINERSDIWLQDPEEVFALPKLWEDAYTLVTAELAKLPESEALDARNEMPDTPPVIAVARDVWNRFYQTEAAGLFEDDGYSGPPVHITVPAPLVTNPKFSSRPSGQGEENEEDDDDGDDDEVSEHLLRVAAAKDGFDAPITSSLNDALRNGIRFLTWDPSEPRLVRAAALTLEKIVDRLNHENWSLWPRGHDAAVAEYGKITTAYEQVKLWLDDAGAGPLTEREIKVDAFLCPVDDLAVEIWNSIVFHDLVTDEARQAADDEESKIEQCGEWELEADIAAAVDKNCTQNESPSLAYIASRGGGIGVPFDAGSRKEIAALARQVLMDAELSRATRASVLQLVLVGEMFSTSKSSEWPKGFMDREADRLDATLKLLHKWAEEAGDGEITAREAVSLPDTHEEADEQVTQRLVEWLAVLLWNRLVELEATFAPLQNELKPPRVKIPSA